MLVQSHAWGKPWDKICGCGHRRPSKANQLLGWFFLGMEAEESLEGLGEALVSLRTQNTHEGCAGIGHRPRISRNKSVADDTGQSEDTGGRAQAGF